MKFLIVIHYAAPHIGGMETLVAKQAQSLIDRGHSVTIATCRPDGLAPLHEVLDSGVIVQRFRSANFIENKFGVTFPLISPHNLFWFLKHMNDYDIVHIHDVFYMPSWFAGLACRLLKKPYFVTQHVGIVDHPSKLVLFVERAVYAVCGDIILRKAQKVVAYNDNVVKFLKSRGVKTGSIIQNYNGIDTDHFSPATIAEKKTLRKQYGLKTNARIVLFVGRLVPKKGYQIVLDGVNSINTYIIAGSGTIPESYKNLPNVIAFGPASQEQLRDLYRLSDVFVFPSVGEVFTLVHQEALASGLPVIISNDPGYARHEVDRSLMLLPKRTIKATANAVESVLRDTSLRQSMAQYSREIATERFSWKNNYAKEYAIYELTDEVTV